MARPRRPVPTGPATSPPPDWHAEPEAAVLAALYSSERGLGTDEVERRLALHGPNALPSVPKRRWWQRLGAQFHNVLIYVLLGAAALAAAVGHLLDAAVVVGVVLVNALVGLVQEGRADRALEAIQRMMDPQASALRNGRWQRIDAQGLVPGDIVRLEAGDRVPADVRVLRAHSLRVEEAALTGESVPTDKQPGAVPTQSALGDRSSMAYSGTLVVAGQGSGVVVATGTHTELGRIGVLLGSVATLRTPLLRRMDAFARRVTAAILVLSAAVFAYAVLLGGYGATEALMVVVGLAVAAIPEGLPAVMTITLAVGVQRMAARHAVIRQLPAVETLGSVTIICSDKTGTLTRNQMMVAALDTGADGPIDVEGDGYRPVGRLCRDGSEIDADARAALAPIGRAAALCNDASMHVDDDVVRVHGDPMEAALLALAGKLGQDPDPLRESMARLDAVPFDARHRYMATLHADGAGAVAMLKGAPERVLELCERVRGDAGLPDANDWHGRAERLAGQGLRVLALAQRHFDDIPRDFAAATASGGFELLGLVGLIDPPRAEARDAVAECRAAGIEVKMVTGDHIGTAVAIARELGLHPDPRAVEGRSLDALDDAALVEVAGRSTVFARTSPEHKLRLVQALQANGAVIAMTGDGVNDAPALKRADVGVAMGRGGTEAAKAAAEMVLTDDNFATIVAAVREGRTVYDNLRKVIAWTLPTNGGEALVILAAVVLGLTLPITPVQILWVNMVTAVALGLTLAFEPPEPNVMRRPPRPPGETLLQGRLLWRIGFVSMLFVAAVFAVFEWALWRAMPIEGARTMVVNTLVSLEIFYLFSVRFVHGTSLTWRGALGTPAVLIGVGAVAILQLVFTYAPPMQALFGTEGLALLEGAVVLCAGILLLAVVELEKWIVRAMTDPSRTGRTAASG